MNAHFLAEFLLSLNVRSGGGKQSRNKSIIYSKLHPGTTAPLRSTIIRY